MISLVAALVNSPAEDGATPLYLAAQGNHVECVEQLLQAGADANIFSRDPEVLPLHAALQLGHELYGV